MGSSERATPRSRREVLDDGVARRALARDPWVSPHRGFHRDQVVNDAVRQRILDAAAVLPDSAVIGGWASAYLQGVSYLDGRDQPLLAIIPPEHQVKRPGIIAVRTELDPALVIRKAGVRCCRAVRAAYDLMRLAPGLTEAVVAGDCLLHSGLTDLDAVAAYAGAHRRRRGLRQLDLALPLLDPATASPPESRLRMLCRFDAGLPALLVNVPVYDADGNFLGIPDLLEPVAGLAIEYDGAQHRELEQHTADNLREERLEGAGLSVVRVTSLDLRDRTATAARIHLAHRRRLDRDPSTDTWLLTPRTHAA